MRANALVVMLLQERVRHLAGFEIALRQAHHLKPEADTGVGVLLDARGDLQTGHADRAGDQGAGDAERHELQPQADPDAR